MDKVSVIQLNQNAIDPSDDFDALKPGDEQELTRMFRKLSRDPRETTVFGRGESPEVAAHQ